MTRCTQAVSTVVIVGLASLVGAAMSSAQGANVIIDDMSQRGQSSYGGQWQLSSDRVMGGRSNGQAAYVAIENDANQTSESRQAVRLYGEVTTANNGGFIQVSHQFRPQLDASDFRGIQLRVRGDGQRYWVHLRDETSRRPWQVFRAGYETNGSWQTIRLAFSQFESYRPGSGDMLDPSALTRIGLVAGYDDYQADISISDVRLYR